MTQPSHSLPIDAAFDVSFADRLARLETYNKHHYRPNTYFHKWWARRCGTTFRLILKQLVADEAARDYYAPGGLAHKVVLDPMMGGGTTLHEAIRLGASVIGADLDPIPVLQARATLSEMPHLALEQTWRAFYKGLRADLEPYFMTTCPLSGRPAPLWFTLYGLRQHCDCGPALLVDSLTLRQETDGTAVRLCPHCRRVTLSGEPCDCPSVVEETPVVARRKACKTCGKPYQDELETPFYARYEPLAVAGYDANRQLFFKAVDDADRALLAQADAERPFLFPNPGDFDIDPGRKSAQLVSHGVHNYLDLFSSRQLLYLRRAMDRLHNMDGLARLNLALLVSTSLEFNAMLCGYKGRGSRRSGAIRHTFSHHAYSFPFTALENNPLYPRKKSGTLQKLYQSRVRNGRSWASRPRERVLGTGKITFRRIDGEVDAGVEVDDPAALRDGARRFYLRQGSSTSLPLADKSVDFIVTDPPYFDSVQYSDLSAFFRVWLMKLLPDAADWAIDTRQSAVDPHKQDHESRYRELLSGIFAECGRVLREDGRFIFTFHHWNPKAWAAVTAALRCAGFVLVNRYVVHSENPISVHINNMNALTHDAILVCARREAGVERVWTRPKEVDKSDSANFCRDCAALLGWMLAAEQADAAIDDLWREALKA